MLQWLGEISEKSSGGCFLPSQAEFQGCLEEQLHALNADGWAAGAGCAPPLTSFMFQEKSCVLVLGIAL